MAFRLDYEKLIERLPTIEFEGQADDEQSNFEQMSLAGVLLTLADVGPETEYLSCRKAALHLLGQLKEPEDIVLE